MDSKDNTLFCTSCNVAYEMDTLGRLSNKNGETKFSHIPDWFEWQRANVKNEIQKGEYNVELDVIIESLPNSTGFYRLKDGILKHSDKGFILKNSEFIVKADVIIPAIGAMPDVGLVDGVKVTTPKEVIDVIGGFHLLKPSDKQLNGTLTYFQKLKSKELHACHCVDLNSKIALSKVDNLKEVGVGLSLYYK